MTETSLVWTDDVGHGGPYSQDAWRTVPRALAGGDDGVLRGERSEYAVSINGSDLRVAAGRALVNGTISDSDANVDQTPAVPVVDTTGLRMVLRKDWTLRTITIELLEATDGTATPPAVTQTDGVTYEISLAIAEITTGGVIQNLRDERVFIESQSAVEMLREQVRSAGGRVRVVDWEGFSIDLTDDALQYGGITHDTIANGSSSAATVADKGMRLTTGATSGGHSKLVTEYNAVAPDTSPVLIVRFVTDVAGTIANMQYFIAGFTQTNSSNLNTDNGAYLRQETTGNLFFVTRTGGSETTTDLGAVSTERQWTIFTPDAGVTWLCVDDTGAIVAAHSTDVPVAATPLYVIGGVIENNSTNSVSCEVSRIFCDAAIGVLS